MTKEKRKKIWISKEVYEMLEAFAKKRGKTVDQLAGELLEIDMKPLYERAKKTGYIKA